MFNFIFLIDCTIKNCYVHSISVDFLFKSMEWCFQEIIEGMLILLFLAIIFLYIIKMNWKKVFSMTLLEYKPHSIAFYFILSYQYNLRYFNSTIYKVYDESDVDICFGENWKEIISSDEERSGGWLHKNIFFISLEHYNYRISRANYTTNQTI